MSLTKRKGFGVQLLVDPTDSTTYAALGAVVSGLDRGEAKADEVDTSVLADKYKTKATGQIDPGHLTFQIAYDPTDTATTTVLTGLLSSGAQAHWQVKYPIIGGESQQVEAFHGVLLGFKQTIDKTKMIVADITIAVSGDPGFTGDT